MPLRKRLTISYVGFFAAALIVGIVSGTYSTVFIASYLLVLWNASAAAQRFTLVRPSASRTQRAQRAS